MLSDFGGPLTRTNTTKQCCNDVHVHLAPSAHPISLMEPKSSQNVLAWTQYCGNQIALWLSTQCASYSGLYEGG